MSDKENSKKKILKTAARLFRQQGYHATGLNQIIQESGAPKGSLYYYFPNGKEELAVESVRITKQKASAHIKEMLAPYKDIVQAFQDFFIGFQDYVNNYDETNDEGVPIGLLALETSSMSEPLRMVCKQTYQEWQAIFENKMIECGVIQAKAKDISLIIIILLEGAVTMSAVNHSSQPFVVISKQVPSFFNGS